jgi:hypothetical protein
MGLTQVGEEVIRLRNIQTKQGFFRKASVENQTNCSGKKSMINKYLIINILWNTDKTDLADNHG